jgi:uncharacterized protein (TIGR03083 family)
MSIDHQSADALLAAYVLDAVDVDEALDVEAHVADCAACQQVVAELQKAADTLAATTTTAPPSDLRPRVLAEALARRPASHVSFSPAEVHLIESTRVLTMLQRLRPEQWAARGGPAFPDWSVQDLVAHLASSEALLAAELGVDPFTPETEDQPEPRAHAAVTRHRRMTPEQTLAELHTAYDLVHQAVDALGAEVDTRIISWFGFDLALSYALTQRSFEIWTHADDIRAALGLPLVPPPGGSVQTMSSTVIETVPIMLAASGVDAEGRRARLLLTGSGEGRYDVDLGLTGAETGAEPDVVIEIDAVDFCRAIGDRLAPPELSYRASGDTALADAVVGALPALAVL